MANPRVSEFRYYFMTYFNLDEMKSVAFDLSINPEFLRHQTLQELGIALIGYCARHNLVPDLVELCKRERSYVPWPDLTLSDLHQLRNESNSDSSLAINIDNSKNFTTDIKDLSGGTFIQGESVVIGGGNTLDCPDCFGTGLEYEICRKCGGTGREKKFIDPSPDKRVNSDDGFLKKLFDTALDINEYSSNYGNPRNHVYVPCSFCKEEGVTLLTEGENFVKNRCPTCKGSKKVPLDINGKYLSQYSDIIIHRSDDFFLVKHIEIFIQIDNKLVGVLRDKDITIKTRKGNHEIRAINPYSILTGHSQRINFSTRESRPVEFICRADMPGLSYVDISMRKVDDGS